MMALLNAKTGSGSDWRWAGILAGSGSRPTHRKDCLFKMLRVSCAAVKMRDLAQIYKFPRKCSPDCSGILLGGRREPNLKRSCPMGERRPPKRYSGKPELPALKKLINLAGFLEFFGVVYQLKFIDDFLDVAVHYIVQIVERKPDAMVC